MLRLSSKQKIRSVTDSTNLSLKSEYGKQAVSKPIAERQRITVSERKLAHQRIFDATTHSGMSNQNGSKTNRKGIDISKKLHQ